MIELSNSGDTAMDGSENQVLARLPVGMTAVEASITTAPGFDFIGSPCTAGDGVSPVAGASDVRCTNFDPISPGLGGGGYRFHLMRLTVRVDAGVSEGTVLAPTFTASGGGAGEVSTVDTVRVSATPPGFGLETVDAQQLDAAGNALMQAGGHPASASVSIDFNTVTSDVPLGGIAFPPEPVKTVVVELPPGFIGNPTALDRCTAAQLANSSSIDAKPLCPSTSQAGTTTVRSDNFKGITYPSVNGPLPVFNMVPPPNVPARFGFNLAGTVVVFDALLRNDGDYTIAVNARNIPEALSVAGTTVTLWGVPSDESHDLERACPGFVPPVAGGPNCESGGARVAFLRNPTSCTPDGVGVPTTVSIDSWLHPGAFHSTTVLSHLTPGYPLAPISWGLEAGPDGCDRVPFDPRLEGQPAIRRVNSPSSFAFDLSMEQTDDPDLIAQSDVKTAVVTLPAGVRVSPAAADGLKACSLQEVHLNDDQAPECPEASKVGSLTIDTPLLEDPIPGGIYLAAPRANPFGTLLSIYLIAQGQGVNIKLAGRVEADPVTGQLKTTFENNPQTPFNNLHLSFDGGPRAQLVTPRECGTYTTHAVITGWNGRVVERDSAFTVSRDGNGAPCPPSQFSPDFTAGTERPVAGASGIFKLRVSRDDDDEELRSLSVDMPGGVTGTIAAVDLCPEAQAAAGTCPESSRIGTVVSGAGAGTNPFYITNGRAYLTDRYKGGRFGLSIVVPAVAGPFDLGNVVVRSAIFVDRHTTDLRVVSDPFPTILEGIPLDVRDIRVSIDKPGFMLNPTNCETKRVRGTIESVTGKRVDVSSDFEVGDCASLSIRQRMTLAVGGRGRTQRGRSTPLTATLRQKPGQTNLRFVRVTLPTTINARLTVINDACTRPEFEAGDCEDARTGTATVVTPLLRDPLRGGVYFVKNGNPLPDLFVALRGQVDVDLIGRITIPGSKRLRTTFSLVPDVPFSMFRLQLVSGRDGSVGNATNLCSRRGRTARAEVDLIGQNGKVLQVDQRLKIRGCKSRRASRHRRHARRGR
jgi:hypothetical protein